jgi:hypothetical protein
VLIPGFRKCLQLENKLDSLQERFNSIGDGVGTRLSSRCSRELRGVRSALFMKDVAPPRWSARYSWFPKWLRLPSWTEVPYRVLRRFALFGSGCELQRFTIVANGIDTRIQLAGKLVEIRSEQESDAFQNIPITLRWRREEAICEVETIVSRRILSDQEAREAISNLNDPKRIAALRGNFPNELAARIARICKELACSPWTEKLPGILEGFPTAAKLCGGSCTEPKEGWSAQALFQRDLDAIRLELLYQMIAIERSAELTADRRAQILALLASADIMQIGFARNLLRQVSEGIYDVNIENAIREQHWDTWYEPDEPTDQDVLRVQLRFRDNRLNRAAARENFQCYWSIEKGHEPLKTDPRPEDKSSIGVAGETYELGWDIQLVPPRGPLRLAPSFYAKGKLIAGTSAWCSRFSVDSGSVPAFESSGVLWMPCSRRLYRPLRWPLPRRIAM